MTCEYCVHFGVCPSRQEANKPCCFFKNRSKFIELPCKVGDVVYSYCDDFYVILDYRIETIYIYKDNLTSFEAICSAEEEMLADIDFDLSDIGKTVFLTKEEAERALKGI